MDSDTDNVDIFNKTLVPKENDLFKVIGTPLFICKPFAFLLDKTFQYRYCNACLSQLKNTSGQLYCNDTCQQKDAYFYDLEQIISSTDDLFSKHFERYKKDMTENDFICLNILFFRVLFTGKHIQLNPELKRYHESFFPNDVVYDDIQYFLNIDEFETPSRSVEELQTYAFEYDSLSESECRSMDNKLDLNIPNDEFFKDIYINNQVKGTIDSLLDAVEESFQSVNSSSRRRLISFDEECSSFTGDDYDSPPSASDYFYIDFSRHISNVFSQSPDGSQAERFQNSLKIYRQQNPDFETAEIQGDISNEEKAIAFHKRALRLGILDFLLFHAQHTNTERSKDDILYGDWVRALKKFIANDSRMISCMGECSWEEILRAFYVTIRYSVGIQDFLCSNTFGLGVYLPLTRVEHSCKPNCSFIFEGTQLKVFYRPSKEIEISLDENCRISQYYSQAEHILDACPKPLEDYLPLEHRSTKFSLTIDFQSHLLFSKEKQYIDRFAEFRLLNCSCEKCKDDVVCHLKGYEAIMENEYQEDDDDDDYNDDAEIDAETQVYNDSCQCLIYISDAGKQEDLRFASKIQSILDEMISNSRELIGFYHPRITGFLFYSLCSKFQLILYERNTVMLFYKYFFIDKFLQKVYQSILITHGKDHPSRFILEKVHKLCHTNLIEFYSDIRDELSHLEPSISKYLSLSSLSYENCCNLSQINFSVSKINWERDLLYNHEDDIVQIENSCDSFNFDPEMTLQSCPVQGRKRKISEDDVWHDRKAANSKNNMDVLLHHLDSILDFSNHHYL